MVIIIMCQVKLHGVTTSRSNKRRTGAAAAAAAAEQPETVQ